MENQIKKNLVHIQELLAKGEFIEAMETYLHEDVEIREANGPVKKGKQFNLDFESNWIKEDLKEFIRYEAKNTVVAGNHSYYSAEFEAKLSDGSTLYSEQVVATEWKDGKIYKERYYHA